MASLSHAAGSGGDGICDRLDVIFGLGPYIQPLTREFGWTVTQVTVGLTIATLSQAVAGIAFRESGWLT